MSELKKGKIKNVCHSFYEVEFDDKKFEYFPREDILNNVLLPQEDIDNYRLLEGEDGLRLCPHCNGLAEVYDGAVGYMQVACNVCDYVIHISHHEDEDNPDDEYRKGKLDFLIELWNTRPIEDALRTEIERLNERVVELSNALLVEKADNARMREALEMIKGNVETLVALNQPDHLRITEICEQVLKECE